jgi:hypothetical protein
VPCRSLNERPDVGRLNHRFEPADSQESQMIASRTRRAPFSFAFTCFLAVCLFQTPPAVATTPFPPTVISQKGGRWQLKNDYVGGARIEVVDTNQNPRLLLRIKDAIPNADDDKYVHHTTAGPKWNQFALSYFVTVGGKPYFCVRTWWDRRIVIDLAAAKQVPDRGMEAVLDAEERKLMLDILKGGAAVASEGEGPLAPFFRLLAAVHLSGRIQEIKAVPFLRKLEPLGVEGTYTMGEHGPGVDLKAGEISPQNYSTHGLRRVVQLSLRRLGETPAELPVVSLHQPGSEKAFEPRKWNGPRFERVESLKIAMTPMDVLNILGAPDYVERGQNIHRQGPWEVAWRYDMDARPGWTLLLVWRGHKVEAIEKVSPALWNRKNLTGDDVQPVLIDADGSIRNANALYSNAFKGKISPLK